MTNQELQAKGNINTPEEKLLQKEAKDTDLSAHHDLVNLIAYKYAGKTETDNQEDPDGKDLYSGEVTDKNAKDMLAPFQCIAADKTFGVSFVEAAVKADASYEDIVAIDKLIDAMSRGEIILIQKEVDALKKTIENPQAADNEYKDIADFTAKQKAETWNSMSRLGEVLDKKIKEMKLPPEIEAKARTMMGRIFEDNDIHEDQSITQKYKDIPGIDADSIYSITEQNDLYTLKKIDEVMNPSQELGTIMENLNNVISNIKKSQEKTRNAIETIQNSAQAKNEKVYTLSELPLFSVPQQLSNFLDIHGNDSQELFNKALKEEMDKSADLVSDSTDKNPTGQKTVEGMLEEELPKLSEEEKEVMSKFMDKISLLEGKQKQDANYFAKELGALSKDGQQEFDAKKFGESIKSFIAPIAEIIKAIRGGFKDVFDALDKDPAAKAILESLKVNDIKTIKEAYLIEKGQLSTQDSEVLKQVKKDSFEGDEEKFSKIFDENAHLNAISSATSKSYIDKNEGGDTKTPKEHILNNMLIALYGNDIGEYQKEMKDTNGKRNIAKLNDTYENYKERMETVIRKSQGIKLTEMTSEQEKEMLSRSLVKNNYSALLYYKQEVIPFLNAKEKGKVNDQVSNTATTVPEDPSKTGTEQLPVTTPTDSDTNTASVNPEVTGENTEKPQ